MSRVFRNQVLISTKKQDLGEFFIRETYNNYNVYIDSNIPIIKIKNVFFIGWGVNTISGKSVTKSDFADITSDNFYEKTEFFSGRYICLIDSDFLFTDPTSSFPVYYSYESLSTNLALISSIEGLSVFCEEKYKETLVLPPDTGVPNIRRLIPGQYLNLKNRRAVSIFNYLVLKDNQSMDNLGAISNMLIKTASGIVDLTLLF